MGHHLPDPRGLRSGNIPDWCTVHPLASAGGGRCPRAQPIASGQIVRLKRCSDFRRGATTPYRTHPLTPRPATPPGRPGPAPISLPPAGRGPRDLVRVGTALTALNGWPPPPFVSRIGTAATPWGNPRRLPLVLHPQIVIFMPEWLVDGSGWPGTEPSRHPAHQALERLLPAGRVYAVACGHRVNVCLHTPMINGWPHPSPQRFGGAQRPLAVPVSGGHVQRGEVWWVEFDERRPVVLLSGDDASGIRVMQVVARAGVDITGLGVEVAVGAVEGLPFEGVLRFALPRPGFTPCTWLTAVSRDDLIERAGVLSSAKLGEIENALRLGEQAKEWTPATTAKLSEIRNALRLDGPG